MKRIKDININTKEYWDGFSNDAYQESDRKRGGNRCKFSTVRDMLSKNLDIVDIGCLNGNFYNFLKENNFSVKSFTGVDFSEKLIKRANNRFPEQKWIVSNCYMLPFENETFDVVLLMEILEHIDFPVKALEEAKRICRKNGMIILTVPNEERIKDNAHVWSFTPSSIFDLLHNISSNVQVLLTCSNNRNIVGKAIINFKTYF
ncbi:MAG: class I SAM-dependent methyltransferase [Methanogenium sp.]|jgi:ubiquinone/menaquinone biosynthesis C-methylase UbiE